MVNRIKLWLTAPLRCKFGRHVTRSGYCSYGFGVLTYHCTRCERGFIRRAFEDTSEDEQAWLGRTRAQIEARLAKD